MSHEHEGTREQTSLDALLAEHDALDSEWDSVNAALRDVQKALSYALLIEDAGSMAEAERLQTQIAELRTRQRAIIERQGVIEAECMRRVRARS